MAMPDVVRMMHVNVRKRCDARQTSAIEAVTAMSQHKASGADVFSVTLAQAMPTMTAMLNVTGGRDTRRANYAPTIGWAVHAAGVRRFWGCVKAESVDRMRQESCCLSWLGSCCCSTA